MPSLTRGTQCWLNVFKCWELGNWKCVGKGLQYRLALRPAGGKIIEATELASRLGTSVFLLVETLFLSSHRLKLSAASVAWVQVRVSGTCHTKWRLPWQSCCFQARVELTQQLTARSAGLVLSCPVIFIKGFVPSGGAAESSFEHVGTFHQINCCLASHRAAGHRFLQNWRAPTHISTETSARSCLVTEKYFPHHRTLGQGF